VIFNISGLILLQKNKIITIFNIILKEIIRGVSYVVGVLTLFALFKEFIQIFKRDFSFIVFLKNSFKTAHLHIHYELLVAHNNPNHLFFFVFTQTRNSWWQNIFYES